MKPRNIFSISAIFLFGATVGAALTWEYEYESCKASLSDQQNQLDYDNNTESSAERNEMKDVADSTARFISNAFLASQCGFRSTSWAMRVGQTELAEFEGFSAAEDRYELDHYSDNFWSSQISGIKLNWPPKEIIDGHGMMSAANQISGRMMTSQNPVPGDCKALAISDFLGTASNTLPDQISPPLWFSKQ